MKYDLAIVADLCIDLLVSGNEAPEFGQVEKFVDDYHLGLGGSAAIFASQFAKLGGKPAFYGLIGNDAFGEMLHNQLHESGIETNFLYKVPDVKTSLGLGLIKNQDRAMLTYAGAMESITMSRVLSSGVFQNAKHIHICGFYLLSHLIDDWATVIKEFKMNGGTVSLDTNWAPEGNWQEVHPILPFVDVFVPNEQEAMHISGQSSIKEAGLWLSNHCDLVVIKMGEKGAKVFDKKGSKQYTIPERLLHHLVIKDTTGAGDNFCAGFVFGWLQGQSVKECMELALTCGTSSLNAMGGIDGQWVPKKKGVTSLSELD